MPYPYIPLAAAQPPWANEEPGGMQQQQPMPQPMAIPNAMPPDAAMMNIPGAMPQGASFQNQGGFFPQDDSQAGLRAGISAALAGGSTDSSGAPIPQQYLAAAQKLKQYIEPGPLEQRYMQAETNLPGPVHGLKQHLAALGKGLLMGGPLGLAIGAADPNMVQRAWHRVQNQGLAQGAQAEESSRMNQMRRAQEIATNTGVDPITGMRTPMSAYHQAMAGLGYGRLNQGQERIDVSKANSESLRNSREEINRLRREKYVNVPFENFIKAYNSGMLNSDPEALTAMAEKAGIPNAENIEPKFLPGVIKEFVDRAFGVNTLNLKTGEVKSTGATSVKATEEAGKNTRAAAGIKSREGIASANRAVSEQRLTDSEEKDIDKQARAKHKVSVFAPPEQVQQNEAAIEQERQQMRAAKLQQRTARTGGGSVNLRSPMIGRSVKGKDGRTGVVKSVGPDGNVRPQDIDWR